VKDGKKSLLYLPLEGPLYRRTRPEKLVPYPWGFCYNTHIRGYFRPFALFTCVMVIRGL
jgi:hypothetical protein